jgi:hypothetical protein
LKKKIEKFFFSKSFCTFDSSKATTLSNKPYQKMKKTIQYIIERHKEDPECLFMALGFIIFCTVAFFLLPYFIVLLG